MLVENASFLLRSQQFKLTQPRREISSFFQEKWHFHMKIFAFYYKNGLFIHNSINVSKHMSFEIHPKHPFQENPYCISLRSIFLAHLEASSARVGGLPFIKVPVRFRIGESK